MITSMKMRDKVKNKMKIKMKMKIKSFQGKFKKEIEERSRIDDRVRTAISTTNKKWSI